jgi:hypothetical protein
VKKIDLSNPKNVKFDDLIKLCEHYFGKARNNGSSHYFFKTPWTGKPLINLQRDKNNKKMAKPFQVKQVKEAIDKLLGEEND